MSETQTGIEATKCTPRELSIAKEILTLPFLLVGKLTNEKGVLYHFRNGGRALTKYEFQRLINEVQSISELIETGKVPDASAFINRSKVMSEYGYFAHDKILEKLKEILAKYEYNT
jgi:hypothetical protein